MNKLHKELPGQDNPKRQMWRAHKYLHLVWNIPADFARPKDLSESSAKIISGRGMIEAINPSYSNLALSCSNEALVISTHSTPNWGVVCGE
jgi:hypothetical protein